MSPVGTPFLLQNPWTEGHARGPSTGGRETPGLRARLARLNGTFRTPCSEGPGWSLSHQDQKSRLGVEGQQSPLVPAQSGPDCSHTQGGAN